MAVVRHKEAIHSGHFMISDFEAEEQDEDDIAVAPPPEEGSNIPLMTADDVPEAVEPQQESPALRVTKLKESPLLRSTIHQLRESCRGQAIIDISLNKLFQSMSIAYRQKLTSPKWNRFRGLKLRWKDKIRLNNVIWRCWHMQFVKGQRRLLCAFANPLDIDYHNRTEGSTLLEGKYWKRKLDAIKCEYQKWRRFYCEQNHGAHHHDFDGDQAGSRDLEWEALILRSPFQFMEGSKDDVELESMLNDEGLMFDIFLNASNASGTSNGGYAGTEPMFTTSNSFTNGTGNLLSSGFLGTAVPFPNPKDFDYKNTMNADFIQPGLGPLQPNIEDFSFECNIINDLFQTKPLQTSLPSIPEAEMNGDQNQLKVKNKSELLTDVPMITESPPETVLSGYDLRTTPEIHHQQDIIRFNDQLNQTSFQLTQSNVILPHKNPTAGCNLSIDNLKQGLGHDVINYEGAPKSSSAPSRGQTFYSNSTTVLPPNYNEPENLSMQQQSTLLANDRSVSGIFPPQSSQRSYYPQEAPTMNHHKMRSPKHRVLQQREYLTASTSTTVQTNSFYSQRSPQPTQSHHLHSQRSAPYSLPSTSSAAQTISSQHPSSELRQLLKSTAPASSLLSTIKPEYSSPVASRYSSFASHAVSSSIPPPRSSDVPQSLAASCVNGMTDIDDITGQKQKQNFRGLTHTPQYQEHRRNVHINAEQNRRHSIKHGFEMLRSLVPALSNSPASMKTSKAALLMKGGDYLQQLKVERENLTDQAKALKERTEALDLELTELMAMLPVGESISSLSLCRKRKDPEEEEKLRQLFDAHVGRCTEINWKYWVFSWLMKPMFDSFVDKVCCSNMDEFVKTVHHWLEGQCGPAQMRQSTLVSLKELSVKSEILSRPQQLPQDAVAAARSKKFGPQC